MNSNKTILVTGGGGFLGVSICRELTKRGYCVYSLSRNHYIELDKLNVKTIKVDLAFSSDLSVLDDYKFDGVIHTAALAGVWGKESDYKSINYLGTQKLVDYCKSKEINYFVYTSSPSVVFDFDSIRNGNESIEYPKNFLTHYQKYKALAEQYVLSSGDDNFFSLAIRPHLIWGPGDPHIIPRIIAKGRSGKLKIVGDGLNEVDIIYVDNAALAHVNALEALFEKKSEISNQSYFIGQERPVNLWHFINEILKINGVEPVEDSISFKLAFNLGRLMEYTFKIAGIHQPEPPMTRFIACQLGKSHFFSHEKAKEAFGYTPEVSIEDGLNKTFKHLEIRKEIIS